MDERLPLSTARWALAGDLSPGDVIVGFDYHNRDAGVNLVVAVVDSPSAATEELPVFVKFMYVNVTTLSSQGFLVFNFRHDYKVVLLTGCAEG